MQLDINSIEGKYYYKQEIAGKTIFEKVKIKKSKKDDHYFVTSIKFPFGKKKYKLTAAEIASHIQKGEFLRRDAVID